VVGKTIRERPERHTAAGQSVIVTIVIGELPSSRLLTKMKAGRPVAKSIISRSPLRAAAFTSRILS
jgi:hypothetical protein